MAILDDKMILTKCLIMLYREHLLSDELSVDLVKRCLATIKLPEVNFGINGDREVVSNLKTQLQNICDEDKPEFVLDDLLESIKMCTLEDDKLYKMIKESMTKEMDQKSLRQSTTTIRRTLEAYLRDISIADTLRQAAYMYQHKRDKIEDPRNFITTLIGRLEALNNSAASYEKVVINQVDLGDDRSMFEIFERAQKVISGDEIYRFGWQDLNDMAQGGIRPGEFMTHAALQHNYKTGFNLSLFAQIALFNKPLTKDLNKKPLLLRITAEDELEANLIFLYQYLKYNETKQFVSTKNVSVETMSQYVTTQLKVNGFNIKMIRVNPSDWTYFNYVELINSLEADGYSVEVCAFDYVGKTSTAGCNNTGPTGTDLRDLFRRMRNFNAQKRIAFITPHQLSTDAKVELRGGVPESEFVKLIANKGYYERSKQLDQEIDLEIYHHIFKRNGRTFLSVQRGKHRLPTVIPEKYKYFILEFPEGMPIPHDLNDENHKPMRRPPAAGVSNGDEDDLF